MASSILRIGYIVPVLLMLFFTTSCSTSRKAVYFNNFQDSVFNSSTIDQEPVIQKNDLLNISISSLNPKATEIFNQTSASLSVSEQTTAGISSSNGYLVGVDGMITLPVLGKLKAAGLSKLELTNRITDELIKRELLVDPIVTIRFLNFRITVLGEVNRPAVVTVASEKISILEAIGLAGDLTIYGRRDNVTLIREEGGRKIVKRLNLNSGDIFLSPYYYLKSNDIVYAEPNRSKIGSTNNARQILPIVLSGVSIIAIILTRTNF